MAAAVYTRSNYHKSRTGPYENPWPPVISIFESALAFLRLPFERATPLQHDLPHVKTVKTVKPDFAALDAGDRLCAMWLGHAGYLVQFPAEPGHRPIRIVFDPIFSDRAFPSAWVGPRRRLPAPCTIHELPDIDFVAVSHNHFDHCDLDALKALSRKSPSTTLFLVPLGVKETLASVGIPSERIHELDWWDSLAFPPGPASALAGRRCSYRFTCAPAQHNSGRGILDQNWTLWCSWAVHQIPEDEGAATVSVYHAGDTGYQTAGGACPIFKEIGTKLGPFDLAMVPIWSGASLTVLGKMGYRLTDDTHLVTLHATPEDAVRLAADVRARAALAMHFGTFAGSEDEALEPALRLARAQAAAAAVVVDEGDREVEGPGAVTGSSSSTLESSPGSGSGSERTRVGIEVIDVGECVTFEVGGVPVALSASTSSSSINSAADL
ncbi:beta-lactamase superfamily domain-containing protein [Mycena pura]|uniref:Beta-lactamase superfamily domain-containing protein n=1 Tax=Mycena pura TaxID=153505 RepID=A0AAD6YIR6_9AGAR|nr:beta-lactamase superfamily domain-containing protein [Mycena pura]